MTLALCKAATLRREIVGLKDFSLVKVLLSLTGCKLQFLAVKYLFSILVKMEHIHLNLGSNKKPNRYSEFFMRSSVLKRIALLFEYFYTKYPFIPYSNSFLSDQYSK